jgi:hypothetical protein
MFGHPLPDPITPLAGIGLLGENATNTRSLASSKDKRQNEEPGRERDHDLGCDVASAR